MASRDRYRGRAVCVVVAGLGGDEVGGVEILVRSIGIQAPPCFHDDSSGSPRYRLCGIVFRRSISLFSGLPDCASFFLPSRKRGSRSRDLVDASYHGRGRKSGDVGHLFVHPSWLFDLDLPSRIRGAKQHISGKQKPHCLLRPMMIHPDAFHIFLLPCGGSGGASFSGGLRPPTDIRCLVWPVGRVWIAVHRPGCPAAWLAWKCPSISTHPPLPRLPTMLLPPVFIKANRLPRLAFPPPLTSFFPVQPFRDTKLCSAT
jgi:hypothetical protein